jgi:tetratricopeptide (TPR) repeat protein
MNSKGILEKKSRSVVPRWRPFVSAVATDKQLSSARIGLPSFGEGPTSKPTRDYEESLEAFRGARTAWFAGDLLVDAIGLGDDAVAGEIARFLLENRAHASRPLLDIARRYLGEAEIELDTKAPHRQPEVAMLRRQISLYSRNSIAWADLAYYFTLSGKFSAAERAMRTAVGLAPNNRFVLRSAARFLIHRDEYDRAHDLLRRSEGTPHDPWLLAAEISTASAASRRSRFIQRGRAMVKDHTFGRGHVSELASAIGTAEIEAEAPRRRIRSMFDVSLERPTENSVAQAEWASRTHGEVAESPSLQQLDGVHEAQAWSLFVAGEYTQTVEFAEQWFADQPFSSRPAELASWIYSSLLDRHVDAIRILKKAVVPNPKDPIILNNLAFAYANLSLIAEAKSYIDRAQDAAMSDHDRLFILATRGLIAFRSKQYKLGRSLYMEVIDTASKGDVDSRIEPFAWSYLAREECLASTEMAPLAIKNAIERSASSTQREVATVLGHLEPLFLSCLAASH